MKCKHTQDFLINAPLLRREGDVVSAVRLTPSVFANVARGSNMNPVAARGVWGGGGGELH